MLQMIQSNGCRHTTALPVYNRRTRKKQLERLIKREILAAAPSLEPLSGGSTVGGMIGHSVIRGVVQCRRCNETAETKFCETLNLSSSGESLWQEQEQTIATGVFVHCALHWTRLVCPSLSVYLPKGWRLLWSEWTWWWWWWPANSEPHHQPVPRNIAPIRVHTQLLKHCLSSLFASSFTEMIAWGAGMKWDNLWWLWWVPAVAIASFSAQRFSLLTNKRFL